MKTKLNPLFVLLFVALLVAACSSPARNVPQGEAVSALTQAEAAAIVENAMQGYKDGDYAAWSRDWSQAMKDAISEADFLTFRQQLTEKYGKLVSTGPVEILPGVNEGYVRWSTVSAFEKGQVRFNFGFTEGGKLIEGVLPEPVE